MNAKLQTAMPIEVYIHAISKLYKVLMKTRSLVDHMHASGSLSWVSMLFDCFEKFWKLVNSKKFQLVLFWTNWKAAKEKACLILASSQIKRVLRFYLKSLYRVGKVRQIRTKTLALSYVYCKIQKEDRNQTNSFFHKAW